MSEICSWNINGSNTKLVVITVLEQNDYSIDNYIFSILRRTRVQQ